MVNPFRGSSPIYPSAQQGQFFNYYGHNSHAGLNPYYSDQRRLQLNFGWVNAAVMRRANDIMTLDIQTKILDRRRNKWLFAPDDPFQQLLDYPNKHLSGMDLLNLSEQFAALLGKVTYLIVENPKTGVIDEIHILQSDKILPIPDAKQMIAGWEYTTIEGKKLVFNDFDPKRPSPDGVSVFQYRVPSVASPYQGNSTVQAASNSIGMDNEIRAYAKYYFANNATPGLILETDSKYPGSVKAQQIRDDWNAAFQGATNSGKVAVGWEGLKAKTLAPPFSELEYPSLARASKMDVLDHFGVPSIILGNDDTGNLGGDATNARRHIYQKHTLDPSRARHQQALNFLRRRYDEVISANRVKRWVEIESPVEEERKQRWETAKWEYENAVISRSEYRDLRDYEEDLETADFYVVNKKNNIIPKAVAHDPEALIVLSTSKKDLDKADAAQEELELGDGEETPDEETPDEERALAVLDKNRVKVLKSIFRSTFAGEYRALKQGGDVEKLAEEFTNAWQERAPLIKPEKISQLREYAVRNFGLVKGYEVLKASGADLLARYHAEQERNTDMQGEQVCR